MEEVPWVSIAVVCSTALMILASMSPRGTVLRGVFDVILIVVGVVVGAVIAVVVMVLASVVLYLRLAYVLVVAVCRRAYLRASAVFDRLLGR